MQIVILPRGAHFSACGAHIGGGGDQVASSWTGLRFLASTGRVFRRAFVHHFSHLFEKRGKAIFALQGRHFLPFSAQKTAQKRHKPKSAFEPRK
jgi:hypothetical protein